MENSQTLGQHPNPRRLDWEGSLGKKHSHPGNLPLLRGLKVLKKKTKTKKQCCCRIFHLGNVSEKQSFSHPGSYRGRVEGPWRGSPLCLEFAPPEARGLKVVGTGTSYFIAGAGRVL